MERQNWLEINDYIYKSVNLDSDEKIILSVIISFTKDGKKFYMSQKGFSETYGMPSATVSRKFRSLKKDGIIDETKNGLCINMSELEFTLNLVKKIKKTRKGGPGRKKKENHSDSLEHNHHDLNKNHHDTEHNHHDSLEHNHHDLNKNHHDIKKNQGDYQLLKDNNKVLPKDIKKDTKKDINENLDDSFFDDIDLSTTYYKKPEIDIDKKPLPENWIEELNLDI